MAIVPLDNSNSLKRTVQFFRVFTSRTDAGGLTTFDAAALCEAIDALSKTPEKYQIDKNEIETTCWLDQDTDRDRLVVATIKRKDFPLTERRSGERGTLEMLADQGLAEIVHARFLPNNIVGIDYNHFGPRASRLKYFLRDKFPEAYRELQLDPIIDADTVKLLAGMKMIRRFELRMPYNAIANLQEPAHDYVEALEKVLALGNAGVIDFVLSMEKRNEQLDLEKVKALAMALFQAREQLGNHGKIVVVGLDADGKAIELDLLSDRVVAEQRVLRMDGRSRTVDSKDAFRAIGEAYNLVTGRIPLIPIE